ncbi:MAG: glycine betaine/L-proline ABC transporter ATP-binding protein [Rhizobiaceae bacterium]
MDDHGIEVKNLYKIFGPHGERYIEAVEDGMSKEELNAKHGHVLGLKNINISMPSAKIQVIMGLSGSGKSTMIRHINRLIAPTAGEVIYQGEDVCKMSKADLLEFRRHKTAMVFQKFALLPHRTVIDNTLFGIELQGVSRGESEERAKHWLKRVGLDGFEDYYPNQLSGGMQQRVGLARALTNDADILLMDEAFSALDPLIRMDMQSILLELQEELHKTIVFITHDLDEALRLGDRIAILRDGIMVQQDEPQQILLNPADEYVTDFIKDINRVRVLQVGSVMNKSKSVKGPKIDRNVVIEEALQILSKNKTNSAVITEDGKAVGSINMDILIASIARRKSSKAGGENYK